VFPSRQHPHLQPPLPSMYSPSQRVCAVLVCAAFLSACGVSLPYAPAYPTDDPFFSEPQPIALPGLPNDVPPHGTIMPGDVLNIQVISADTTTHEGLVVDAEGRVHLPLVGDVKVGGMRLGEAEQAVKEAMKRFDRLAEVAVIMGSPDGHAVTVLGAVSERGRIQLPPGARVADVIALAGGPMTAELEGQLVPISDLDGARIYRQGAQLPVSIAKAVEGDPLHNVYVHPGDHIYVPPLRGQAVSVLGQVNSARAIDFRPGLRLTEALAIAGGPSTDADLGDIRVIRGSLAAPRVYETSLSTVLRGQGHDVMLAPGDVVFVTTHWSASVSEVLSIVTPILALGTTFLILYMNQRLIRDLRTSD
jgi:polysaccharide export outer membrane protein